MSVFLFHNYTNFESGHLTGAHKRFIELVYYLSNKNKIIMVSQNIPQLSEQKNIEFHLFKLENDKRLPAHIVGMKSTIKKLREINKSIEYDYAVAFASTDAVCYKISGYKRIVTLLREDTIEYGKVIGFSKLKLFYYYILENIAVRASDRIIVQCNKDRENLIKRNKSFCKNVLKKTFVQINNVNASWMKSSLLAKRKNNNIVNIMFVGDFSNARKGHDILLPAIARLIDEGIKIQLFIAGDGKEMKTNQKKYSGYPYIVFLGRISNVDEYMMNCDINIVPSLIDSCPNTVLEGLCSGVTVYGANTGGIPDLLIHKEWLFEPNEDSIYLFLKAKIQKSLYIDDGLKQQERKKELSFNWSKKIQDIIENKI